MSELQVHLALIRENWDRHDHWFDALCNNLVRGHMKELEALAAQSPPPVSEMRMPSREAMRQKIDADPDLETEACTPTTTQGDEAAGETAAFPPSCCTAWEDCNHDGVCHDPTGCGAVGPNAYESDHEGEDTP